MKYKIATILLLLICITGFVYYSLIADKTAPDVSFTTITGKKIELKALLGQPVIITFWATDCASCIEEVPHLIDLYDQFHPQGLEIIAINMYYDIPSHVVEMTRLKQIPYKVALDLRSEHAQAFGDIELTPTTLLISPEGKIIKHITGFFDIKDMKSTISKFLQG